MLRVTSRRLAAAKIDSRALFNQINPNPWRNWRSTYQAKFDLEAQRGPEVRKAEHDHTYPPEAESGYANPSSDGFLWPAFYGMIYFLYLTIYMLVEPNSEPMLETNRLKRAPTNPDGSTQWPTHPQEPAPFFKENYIIRDEAVKNPIDFVSNKWLGGW
eukprot:Hpha_TRINITY_DN10072_c0_g1::TRINITY_DN10072_c0_g1_i1::g.84043::m.84043